MAGMNDTWLAVVGLLAAGVLLSGAGFSAWIWIDAPRLGIVILLALLALAVLMQCATWRRLARSPRAALAATLASYLGAAVLYAPALVAAYFGVQARCGQDESLDGLLCSFEIIVPVVFLGPGACLFLAGMVSIAVLQRRRAQVSRPP